MSDHIVHISSFNRLEFESRVLLVDQHGKSLDGIAGRGGVLCSDVCHLIGKKVIKNIEEFGWTVDNNSNKLSMMLVSTSPLPSFTFNFTSFHRPLILLAP